MPLQTQTFNYPFGMGLSTKEDPRALPVPKLSALKNGTFTEAGGIQKRYPMVSVTGATLTIRKLAAYNDELIAFTSTEIYSWAPALAGWVSRGTYLAAKVTERQVFNRTTEQTQCDRAELNNVVVYCWYDQSAAFDAVFVAAMDKTSGAVIYEPVSLGSTTMRPRLVALNSKILFVMQDDTATTLSCKALDVSTAALFRSTAEGAFTTISTDFSSNFDVAKLSSTSAVVVWRLNSATTSYGYASVTEGLTVTASTKVRPCTGPIGVAVTAAQDKIAVIRQDTASTIKGDILTSGFVDSQVSKVISGSSAANRLAVAFRSVTNSSEYRCYAFWSDSETATAATNYITGYNYVDTAGNVGAAATFKNRLGPVSKAFDHNGSVYVWLSFIQTASGTDYQVQNTNFLYRDDGLLVAKATPSLAGGIESAGGHIASVQSLGSNTFAFASIDRRIVPAGSDGLVYADRGIREVVFTFDSNEARRTVQLGKTLYITGGQVMQFDGQGATEVGFHIAPGYLAATDSTSGSGLVAGSYTYIASLRWDNAKGEIDRSTVVSSSTVSMANNDATINFGNVNTTLKAAAQSRSEATMEIWRTPVNPSTDSPYYLVTSKDPNATGSNGFRYNDATGGAGSALTDALPDTTLIGLEAWGESGGVLENLAPPPATVIASDQDRLYLAGISYDPNLIWYSKTRGEGQIAAFHDALTVTLPATGGDITAMAVLNENLVVFKENAVYVLQGSGFDNLGGGSNFTVRLLASDVGAQSAETVAVLPRGIMFMSDKGWFLVDRGFNVTFIGAPVEDYNSDTFLAVHVLETQHQVRCLSSSRILVWDYLADAWSEWEEASRVDAAIWQNSYYVASTTTLLKEATSHGTDVTYSLSLTTAWINFGDLLGFKRFTYGEILGEYRSAHRLKIELFKDYDDSTAFQTILWTVSPTTVGGPLQAEINPSIQKLEALKIRITDIATGSSNPPTGEGYKITGLALDFGFKKGLHRLPAAQKV